MRKESVVISVVVLVVLLLIGFLYYNSKESKTVFKWHKTLDFSEKEPYDLGLFLKLVNSGAKDVSFLNDEMRYTVGDEESELTTYLFVGV